MCSKQKSCQRKDFFYPIKNVFSPNLKPGYGPQVQSKRTLFKWHFWCCRRSVELYESKHCSWRRPTRFKLIWCENHRESKR